MKTYLGKADQMDDWDHLEDFEDKDGFKWGMFCKPQRNPDWDTFKVVSYGRVPRKANYWFAYNHKTGQIGFARDLDQMEKHRKNMFKWVKKVLEL